MKKNEEAQHAHLWTPWTLITGVESTQRVEQVLTGYGYRGPCYEVVILTDTHPVSQHVRICVCGEREIK